MGDQLRRAHRIAGGRGTIEEEGVNGPLRPRDLIERSNLRGALVLLRDWGMIIGLAALGVWAQNVFVTIVCIYFIGVLQFSLRESVLHEAAHYNLFRTRALNDWTEFLHGSPMFYDLAGYREVHFAHHRNLNSHTDRVFDSVYRAGYINRSRGMWWLWGLRPILGYATITYVLLQVGRLTWKIVLCMIVMIGGAWLLGRWDGLKILGLYWFVPLLTFNAAHDHWSGIPDHLHVKKTPSRSNVSPIFNFFNHNLGYHHVHHMYPAIPWYNLKKAHAAFCPKDADITHNIIETYRQISDTRGVLPVRSPAPAPKLLRNAMMILNWYPGDPYVPPPLAEPRAKATSTAAE